MIEMANHNPHPDGLRTKVLNQAAREVLLAQSSDWAFIMKTGTMVDYAVNRTKQHVTRFNRLFQMMTSGQIDSPYLADLEHRDNLFPEIDFRVYRSDYRFQ
jgi:1,4-alpha-glucan branching enzyme